MTGAADGRATEPDNGRFAWAMLVAVLAISFAAVCFRKASPTHPLVAAAVRLWIATLLLAPWSLAALRAGRLPLRAAIGGALGYAVHFGAWVWSLGLTTVGASVTLVTTTPLLLSIVGVITGRDRPGPALWGALALASVGVVLIGGGDLGLGSAALLGDGLALLGAVAMAAYLLVVRSQGPSLDVLAFQGAVTFLAATILSLVAALLSVPLLPPTRQAWLWLLLCALLPQIVGHGLLTWGLRHGGPARVAMVTVGEPVGASILAWILLGETVPPPAILGSALTLSGVAWALRDRSPDRANAQAAR